MQIEVKERAERVSIFLRKRKICSTQIEGKDSSREGTKIEERTAAFIADLYGTVFEGAGTIFKADFWARFSRKTFLGHRFRGLYSPYIDMEIEAENKQN